MQVLFIIASPLENGSLSKLTIYLSDSWGKALPMSYVPNRGLIKRFLRFTSRCCRLLALPSCLGWQTSFSWEVKDGACGKTVWVGEFCFLFLLIALMIVPLMHVLWTRRKSTTLLLLAKNATFLFSVGSQTYFVWLLGSGLPPVADSDSLQMTWFCWLLHQLWLLVQLN